MSKAVEFSKQQLELFDFVVKGEGSAVVSAVAGAGKTFSLTHAVGLMNGRVFFGAYNKSIAGEIKAKLKDMGLDRNGLDVSTMHSAGFKAWLQVYPKVQVTDTKTSNLIKLAILKDSNFKKFGDHAAFVKKLVSFGKSHLMGIKQPVDKMVVWKKLMCHYSLDEGLPETEEHPVTKQNVVFDIDGLLNFTVHIFKESIDLCKTIIDFDDQIFAPLYHNVKFPKYSFVILDEAQDANLARREMARRMLAPGGRFIGCGDERQSIYGFTGAGTDSMNLLVKEFDAKRLFLSITYRCPKAIVAYVRQWVDHIEAAETAPEGVVRYITNDTKERPWFVADSIGANDAVLCRYTAPLVRNAFELLRNGIPCKVEGRDIGKNLIASINRYSNTKTLENLEAKLKKHLEYEIKIAEEEESETRKQNAQDIFDTIMIFMEKARANKLNTVEGLIQEIESLFDDNVTGVTTFSTGHKSKGREWNKVYWLETALRARRELKEWEEKQEENINYVIGTRAKNELVLISESTHSPEKGE